MPVVMPDLLTEARGLSPAVTGTGIALGLMLWLFGWRAHRFWVVLLATLVGGLFALQSSTARGVQPLVAGLLAAVAAGVLALQLVRVVAFVGGALSACVLMKQVLPDFDQPLITALVGGLLGVVLFRLWTMVLTSGIGSMLMVYSTLALLDRLGKLDAVAYAEQNTALLNGVCGGLVLGGWAAQVLLERRQAAKKKKKAEAEKVKAEKEKEEKDKKDKKAKEKKGGWTWPLPGRKAG